MDEAAFTGFLTNIGVAEPARLLLRDQGGITTVPTLMEVSPMDLEEMWENLAKTATSMRLQNEANRPILSYPAKRRMVAFRLYLEYLLRSGIARDEAITRFTGNRVDLWLAHAKTLKDDSKRDSDKLTNVPLIANVKKWQVFKELLQTRLSQERNQGLGVPLSYLVRAQAESTQETIRAEYPSLDARLVACVDLNGPMFDRDNKDLYQLLKSKTVDGELWTFVKPFDATQNGRAAYLALLNQAKGPAAKDQRIRNACTSMQNAHFNGKSKNWTFEKYVQRHQECHNILGEPDNDEQLTEVKKIGDFLNGIKDPKLEAAVQVMRSSSAQYNTFDLVQQYLTGEVNRMASLKPEPTGNFRVAGLSQQQKTQTHQGKRKGGQQNHQKDKKKQKTGKGFISYQQRKEMIENGTWAKEMERRKLEKERRKVAALQSQLDKTKKAPSADNPVADQVNQLVTNGVTSGNFVMGGQQVNFSVGAVATAKPAAEAEPAKGTPEELKQAAAKSASAQFSRAYRKKAMAEKHGKLSLDDPIPKKSSKATDVASALKEATISALAAQFHHSPKQPAKPRTKRDPVFVPTCDPAEDTSFGTATLSDVTFPDELITEAPPEAKEVYAPAATHYSAPAKGTPFEEELVNIDRQDAIKLGIDISKFLDDDDDDDEDFPPNCSVLSIPRKYLMEKSSDFGSPEEDADQIFAENLGKVGSDRQKWAAAVEEKVISKVKLRQVAAQYKGNKVFQLGDPLLRLLLQATRYAELKSEHDFEGSWASKEDEREFQRLYQRRQALTRGAAATGDPKANAHLAAWQEAESGGKSLSTIRQVYKDTFDKVSRSVALYEQDPDAYEREQATLQDLEDTDDES